MCSLGLDEPLHTVGGNIPVSASIGIHFATDEDDYDSLLRSADGAMYDAKRSERGGIRISQGWASQDSPGRAPGLSRWARLEDNSI